MLSNITKIKNIINSNYRPVHMNTFMVTMCGSKSIYGYHKFINTLNNE